MTVASNLATHGTLRRHAASVEVALLDREGHSSSDRGVRGRGPKLRGQTLLKTSRPLDYGWAYDNSGLYRCREGTEAHIDTKDNDEFT